MPDDTLGRIVLIRDDVRKGKVIIFAIVRILEVFDEVPSFDEMLTDLEGERHRVNRYRSLEKRRITHISNSRANDHHVLKRGKTKSQLVESLSKPKKNRQYRAKASFQSQVLIADSRPIVSHRESLEFERCYSPGRER